MCAEKRGPYTLWFHYTKRMQMWGRQWSSAGQKPGFGVRQLAAAFLWASSPAAIGDLA